MTNICFTSHQALMMETETVSKILDFLYGTDWLITMLNFTFSGAAKTYRCDCILSSSITSFLPYETAHILNLPYHRLSNKYFFLMVHLKFRATYDNVQPEKNNSRQLTVECHD
jgi:hypothetical protein